MITEQHSARVIVHGRVQGVFFRATTAEQAHLHGVDGWVRNLPDGTVEAHFQGTPAAVEAMVGWCEIGSPHSEVSRVTVSNVPPEACSGFSVRR